MDIFLPVVGGLGLFLYGMNLMGDGLQKIAGKRLKKLIEVLTSNRIMGVLVGALVTMIIQSSSATTVMVIGFVNAGLMSLIQAVGVIMGANIGTTITAQLIAFKITDYAPLAVAIGVAIWIITSKKRGKDIAETIIGFGILFIGMDMMGGGLKPLAQLPAFTNIMSSLGDNPILGVFVGLVITTVVQSSSASIGLLQALAGQGLININVAFPILFGDNIGTTTTTLISSVGANKTAKRAALVHFIFNLIGTILFITILRRPVQLIVERMSPGDIQRQIANAHTIFNFANVIIQLPFAGLLVKLVQKIVPGEDRPEKMYSKNLDSRIIETPSIALGQVDKEIVRMASLVDNNLELSSRTLLKGETENIEKIFKQEKTINKIERELTQFLVELSNAALSDDQHGSINILYNIINDIERAGDHAKNLLELFGDKEESGSSFTKQAEGELESMFDKTREVFKKAIQSYENDDEELARRVLELEDEIDEIERTNRANHINRLNLMQCDAGSGILFLDAISNLERISDHASNISRYVLDKYKN